MSSLRRPGGIAIIRFFVVSCLLTAAAAAWAMPAQPDLVARLGRERVARLQKTAMPASLAEDLLVKGPREKVVGTGTCLVILWDFVDHAADQVAHPASEFTDMLFTYGTYPTGSVNDFYIETSYGLYQIGGLVSGWTTAASTYASYANPDTSQDFYTAQDMLRDAIFELDPVIDFSQFDNDGPDGVPNSGDDDGFVDALFFVHAGPGEESTGDKYDIWSHAWAFWPGVGTADGVQIFRYSVEPETLSDGSMISVGVFAHEYGHVLGLPDLYDTDYSSQGIGEWGLMSGGSWNYRAGDPAGSSPSLMTAWSKAQLGWLTPTVVNANQTGLTVAPAETYPTAFRLFRNGEVGNEYFLIENRRPIGFDEGLVRRQVTLGLAQPEGLVIYHVDDNQTGNSNDVHRLVDVVDASPWFEPGGTWYENLDGKPDPARYAYLDNFNRGDNGDVWPGFTAFNADSTDWVGPRDRDVFSDTSIPPAEDYGCDATGVMLSNIDASGLNVHLDVSFDNKLARLLPPAKSDRIWDFEGSLYGVTFCRSFAHVDQTQAGDCPGPSGLWFGTDAWDCPGYGNDWNDLVWFSASVLVAEAPQVTLRHRYDLEAGYDFAYLEIREMGNADSPWQELAVFGGSASCSEDTYALPASLLDDIAVGGVAAVDIRLRLQSDSGFSAEDGGFCGIGWWVDEVRISAATLSPAVDLPVLTARLETPVPNPFNPTTTIGYSIPAGARTASLEVFDQRGLRVRRLPVQTAPGRHEVRWDGSDDAGRRLASGLYFARLDVDGKVFLEKVAMVK